MTLNLNKILLIAAVLCLLVAWLLTVGWLDATGNARDGWLVGGLALGFGSFLP